MTAELPTPDFFAPDRVGEIWSVPYQQRAAEAKAWAAHHDIAPAAQDDRRLCLLLIDVQNTFCIPGFELFVGGRSGRGAVDDNRRLAEFIYRNLGQITTITATLDTHQAMQVFHPVFWVDGQGEHPAPMTLIHYDEVVQGKWRINPAMAAEGRALTIAANLTAPRDLQEYALHYTKTLEDRGKYPLTIWPYHSMLGGIGHALVPAIEEACFFHTMARQSQTRFELKGSNPLTENYSVLSPEVTEDGQGEAIAHKNTLLIQTLRSFDGVIVAGQAKSHCVAWTVADLLSDIEATDPALAQKIYLLDDCASPVVVPGVVDFTDQAEDRYQRFAEAGMHRVLSTTPMTQWPGLG